MIRLLIADDEKLEREALADMVSRRFEHEVVLELAENGRKAADTAVLWGADLILMDIEMPGMSGLDAARAVLAQRPACRVNNTTHFKFFLIYSFQLSFNFSPLIILLFSINASM